MDVDAGAVVGVDVVVVAGVGVDAGWGGGDQCRCCGQVIDIREEAPGSSDEAESAARWCYAKVSSHPPPAPFRDIMPGSLTFFLFESLDVLLCGIHRSRWCAPTATSP